MSNDGEEVEADAASDGRVCLAVEI
jgi:hypothetical protein